MRLLERHRNRKGSGDGLSTNAKLNLESALGEQCTKSGVILSKHAKFNLELVLVEQWHHQQWGYIECACQAVEGIGIGDKSEEQHQEWGRLEFQHQIQLGIGIGIGIGGV